MNTQRAALPRPVLLEFATGSDVSIVVKNEIYLLFVLEPIGLAEGKISSRYILCKFNAVYHCLRTLTELSSNFYDGCCCLLNIIIK